MIDIRPAKSTDAPAMTELLNAIIETGGTTAQQSLFDDERMRSHYIAPDNNISCQVALDGDDLVGFQSLYWADPSFTGENSRPADWAVIASFVKEGQQGKGIGIHLFEATRQSAIAAGVTAIDARIRADNVPGLAYYERMGFRQDSVIKGVPLRDGTKVDRVRKAFYL